MIVPISAIATVKPSCRGLSPNVSVSECVVPAITAVSKPNSNPPNAPTAVAFIKVEFNFIRACLHVVCAIKLPPNRTALRENTRRVYFMGTRKRDFKPALQLLFQRCAINQTLHGIEGAGDGHGTSENRSQKYFHERAGDATGGS